MPRGPVQPDFRAGLASAFLPISPGHFIIDAPGNSAQPSTCKYAQINRYELRHLPSRNPRRPNHTHSIKAAHPQTSKAKMTPVRPRKTTRRPRRVSGGRHSTSCNAIQLALSRVHPAHPIQNSTSASSSRFEPMIGWINRKTQFTSLVRRAKSKTNGERSGVTQATIVRFLRTRASMRGSRLYTPVRE